MACGSDKMEVDEKELTWYGGLDLASFQTSAAWPWLLNCLMAG